MRKILIADSSDDYSMVLAGALRSRFQVVRCSDGGETLSLLRSMRPDVLIMDPVLPTVHGADIIPIIRSESLCPTVMVIARFFSVRTTETLRRYPVDFAAIKPCPIQTIVDRVEELSQVLDSTRPQMPDPSTAVASILLALNIATNRKGFRYCCMAIPMLAEDPSRQITKDIYPTVGKHYGTTDTSVEKAIRDAIYFAWLSRDNRLWRRYFLPGPDGQVIRPTNSQFLFRLAEAISERQIQSIR